MGPTPFSMSNNPWEHVVPLSPQITQPGPHKASATHVQGGRCWWCGWAVLAVGGPNTPPLHPRIHCSPPMPSLPHTGQTAVCLSAAAPIPTQAQPIQGRATTPADQGRRHGGRGRAMGPCLARFPTPVPACLPACRQVDLFGGAAVRSWRIPTLQVVGTVAWAAIVPSSKIKRLLPAASTHKPPLPHPDMPGLAAGWSCTHIGAPHGARHHQT